MGQFSIAEHQKDNNLCLAQYYLQLNEFMPAGEIRPKKFVPGCNVFCDKTVFESVGGFPEIRAAEDVLFCLNVGEQQTIWLIPSARAYHIFRENQQGFLENQQLLGEYVLRYRRETFDSWCYKGLIPIVLLPLFIGIKVTRMEFRIFCSGLSHWKAHLKSLHWYLRGMVAWGQGFVKGYR